MGWKNNKDRCGGAGIDVKTLVGQVDLVDFAEKYTDLQKQGDVYRGVCPVCQHDNNSEFVVYDHKTYHCWACGSSGDVINLLRDKFKLDFFAAAEKLADIMNVDLTHDKGYKARKEAVNKRQDWAKNCQRNLKVVKDYLVKRRGLSDSTIEYFQLGADEYGNVSIPLIDANGRYVSWAVRRFEGQPKYLTGKNDEIFTKAEFLFNARGAKEQLTNTLYLVEGFFCAMSLYQAGLAGVAYNSSQPSKQHIQKIATMLKHHNGVTVVLVPDNDGVAYPLVEKVRKNLLRYAPELPVEVLMLPDGMKDVNDFFVAGGTSEGFSQLPKEPIDLFVIRQELNKCGSRTAERRVVESYAKTVKDKLILLQIADYLSERWETPAEAVSDFLNVSRQGMNLDNDFKDPDQCVAEAVKMLREPVMSYGVSTLDEGIRGAGRRKDVTIVGACSSVGKTFFTICMAADMVVRQRKHIIFFSLEMSAGALFERLIACLLGRSSDIVDKMLLEGDPLAYAVLEKLREYIYVVDKNGLTIQEIDAYIKTANSKMFDGNLDCIFIDYLQYMKGCSEYQVLAETAKGLKPLAKENNIHVVALSQLNREVKPWERPDMGKLKGGGDIEASGDEILLLWRPEKDPNLLPEERAIKKNKVMCAVGKARHGARIDETELIFDPSTSRITMPKEK